MDNNRDQIDSVKVYRFGQSLPELYRWLIAQIKKARLAAGLPIGPSDREKTADTQNGSVCRHHTSVTCAKIHGINK